MNNWDNNTDFNIDVYEDNNGNAKYTMGKPIKGKKLIQFTKGGFILILIACIIFTSALSFGAVYAGVKLGVFGSTSSKGSSATNYTLTASDETASYESIISKNENAVVSITTESVSNDSWMRNYVTQGAGSGVIIDENGYIMTCNHVIDSASKITVTTKDGTDYSATLVGTDSDNDIAILKIDATGLTAVTYGDSSSLNVGSSVVAIGNPLGELGGTATTGIISALDRELTIDNKTMNLLQTDASINPGNSGGGLFDAAGNLVGIVVAKSSGSDVEGLGFAIPINTAAAIGKSIIETGGSVKSASSEASAGALIGVMIADVNSDTAKSNGLSSTGVYVTQVTSSEAESAGIKAGDFITKFNGTKISSSAELTTALSKCKAGDKVKVVLERDGESVNVTTTLISINN